MAGGVGAGGGKAGGVWSGGEGGGARLLENPIRDNKLPGRTYKIHSGLPQTPKAGPWEGEERERERTDEEGSRMKRGRRYIYSYCVASLYKGNHLNSHI